MTKKPYEFCLFVQIVCWVIIMGLRAFIIKRKTWLNKNYAFSKLTHITIIENLIEARLFFEVFNSWGLLYYSSGSLKNSIKNVDPNLIVSFIDKLGQGEGTKAFVFILLIMVLRIKLCLNFVNSSYVYLEMKKTSNNTKYATSNF